MALPLNNVQGYIKLCGFSLEKAKVSTFSKFRNINSLKKNSFHFNREEQDSIAWKLSWSCSVNSKSYSFSGPCRPIW